MLRAELELVARRSRLALVILVCVVSISLVSFSQAPDTDQQVEKLLAQMTLEEKIDYVSGTGFGTRAIARLNVPAFKMADGPMGVRNYGPATVPAAGINLAATWDAALAQRVGEQIGRDARAKGVHFLLGPGLNIYRAPMNGRNFEYYGEDPYLAAHIAVGFIEGVQTNGVSATAKHFMGDNSEYARHTTNDIMDERTMREIYLAAFEAAVKEAHVGAVMDSYNLVNGEHMTQNSWLNSDILKKEWRFQGVLMSDWFATYDGVAAGASGMDLEMPSGQFMNRETLLPAVRHGKISEAAIDDKVRRILQLAIASHWLERDQTDTSIPRYNLEGRRVALEAASEGIVLLKNDGNLLPLDKKSIKSIAVIGPDAYPAVPVGGGSAGVRPFNAVSFLEGIANELGPGVRSYYDRGVPELSDLAESTTLSTDESGRSPGMLAEYFSNENLEGEPAERHTDAHINFGAAPNAELGFGPAAYPSNVGSARWTGYFSASAAGAYDFFAQSTGEAGGFYRVYLDGKLILDDWTECRTMVGVATENLTAGPHKVVVEHRDRPTWLGARFRFGIARQGTYVNATAEKMAASADAVVLAVGFNPDSESEGADRTFQLPPGQDELIERIAALNKRTIVVVTSGGSVDMRGWLDRVPALLEAWYPGQEGGTALAQVLFGDANPSGRLPVSFERRWEDNPVHDSYYPEPGTDRVAYKEGVFVGYRGYQNNGTRPLFPFGYGLSYTTFRYGNLSVRPVNASGRDNSEGKPSLAYEVSFDVTNTGSRDGADVAEVYVGEVQSKVPRPPRELKSFARVNLRASATQHVAVTLDRRAFAYFDAALHQWRVDPGEFTIFVGRSSDDVQLRTTITLTTGQAADATGP